MYRYQRITDRPEYVGPARNWAEGNALLGRELAWRVSGAGYHILADGGDGYTYRIQIQ
jgi:hypothetical protein